jgi:NAD+ synthase (glutamine-hydrolysing)
MIIRTNYQETNRKKETMLDGFLKVACATPRVTVADVEKNCDEILRLMKESEKTGAKITVFPELCLTGYTCGDLFYQNILLKKSLEGLDRLARETRELDGLFAVGLPLLFNSKIYNCAAVLNRGKILGIVPKLNLPNDHEFYERRQFTPGFVEPVLVQTETQSFYFGSDQIFSTDDVPELKVGIELCEDLWVASPPSIRLAKEGANVILNLSASNEVTGKAAYRRGLVAGQSARLYTSYIYAAAGPGESTQDIVFSGHSIIASNGRLIAENKLYEEGLITGVIDIEATEAYRKSSNTFTTEISPITRHIEFKLGQETTELPYIDPAPFVPGDQEKRADRCKEIFDIQSRGLARRLQHIHAENAVIGISGGLDSTLALLVTAKAFKILELDPSGIKAITMPGFGTTDRTYNNALTLIREIGAELSEISIRDAVTLHFKDIGQDPDNHDITYENSQARERTQILMDMANKVNGIVVGTGDLSELALGWATYNGDHMSMYGVNASVPKTLVRYLVRYQADESDQELKMVLNDILDTPVSPELLPPQDGKISQKTEDLVGPYELHDFYLYYVVRFGYAPHKIYRMAVKAFEGTYDNETILKWLKAFYRRFFSQQFKRSCLPDGPKVGTVSLSPRGDWRMPSDASQALWQSDLDSIQK